MSSIRYMWLVLVAILLTGCLAGPGSQFTEDAPAGFVAGVWHGLIAPFTLIASLLNLGVTMYECANIGPQYDLGFLIGFLVLLGVPATVREIRRYR